MANLIRTASRSSMRPQNLPAHVFTSDEIAGDRLQVEMPDEETMVITLKNLKWVPNYKKGPQLRLATINNRVTDANGNVRGYYAAPLNLQVQTPYGLANLNLFLDLNAWSDLELDGSEEAAAYLEGREKKA